MTEAFQDAQVLAAVDLGSNSFHMVIARVIGGELKPLDRLRERVQLAAGFDGEGRLSGEAQERALACLERFGQRIRELPKGSVRAVGTNTLRKAKNAKGFLRKAREALGHPIKIIPGDEEARLIYLGVAHTVYDDRKRRLVVDIGGGSTECILGTGFEVEERASLFMGCVSFSESFFSGGRIKGSSFRKAEIAARLELQSIEKAFRKRRARSVLGASGTILAIEGILAKAGWCAHGITRQGLDRLRETMLEAGQVDALKLPGMRPERQRVLPGGLAILIAVFESLEIKTMATSQGALREGLLHDLLGRISQEDTRETSVRQMQDRYHVDREQAERVEQRALALLAQVAEPWRLEAGHLRRYLVWAARLHEIGLAISHGGYHKHGAYLVTHSDLPGFSLEGKKTLAALIGSHRRKLRRELFEELPASRVERVERLALLLRWAVLLSRSRSREELPELTVKLGKNSASLRFPEGWIEAHPLVRADLEQEARYLAAAGFELICASC